MSEDVKRVVQSPQRLQKLHELNLLDSPAEAAFDRLTRLASLIVDAPVSLVTIVDADRQFFKSFFGLTEPLATERETPLSHSFCQYVVATGEPLVVEDARRNPLLKNNPAIRDYDVIGYLGMPLSTVDGIHVGSFCVVDSKPRRWSQREIEVMRELAMSVMTEIDLRAEIQAREAAEAALTEHNRLLRRVTTFCNVTLDHIGSALKRGTDFSELKTYVDNAQKELERLS